MSDELEPLKIVLIGESGVGKTTIIAQFIDQIFQEDLQSTSGGTFSTKTVECSNGKLLKLEIWDTAGQERYRSVAKMFYKDANAAILVYDITNKFSFEELKNYWVEQVLESSPKDIILAIIANKTDLMDKEQVDEEEVRKYANKINAFFARTSAKTSYGVNDLFLEISKKYSGAESAKTIEDKGEIEEFKKIRKESVKLTKETQVKTDKKKKCC